MKSKKLWHCLSVAVTLALIAVSVFCFSGAYFRIYEGGRDIGISVAYYFCKMFGIQSDITPTVNNYPGVPPWGGGSNDITGVVPDNWADFAAKMTVYGKRIISGENVMQYLGAIGGFFSVLSKLLCIIIPFILLVRLAFSRYLKNENNDYNRNSIFLRAFKRLSCVLYLPAKRFVLQFIDFVKTHKAYWIIWLCSWLLNFNVFTIGLEAIAYYLYFSVSFDFINLYRQVYKLCLDLSTAVRVIPVWLWIIIALVLLNRWRKNIGYRRLAVHERRNKAELDSLPLVVMLVGTMGSKKTTTMTDMVLSQNIQFREKAFEMLLKNDMKFPFFPWIMFEKEIQRAMECHVVYNLASCREFVRAKERLWEQDTNPEQFYGYDWRRYGLEFDDELGVVSLWEVLENYSQLYFIYVIETALIVSNYSIRVDDMLLDGGNFPLWSSDFFRRNSEYKEAYSRHSHVLDFDALRLGKRVIKDNRNSGAIEFGVVAITEAGKDRGNMLTVQGMKKDAPEANQLNDMFNDSLKMVRHKATVDNYPFIRIFMDEQRPESLGADARELCVIAHIDTVSETKLAMPFFTLGELLFHWIVPKFREQYYQYRFNRGDNTLFMYIMKFVVSRVFAHYSRIYNRFSYMRGRILLEDGKLSGVKGEINYYLSVQKIYAKRFATDCYSEYFAEQALRYPVGLADLPEYQTERATLEELRLQNSYFVRNLLKALFIDGEQAEQGENTEQ